MCLTYCKQCRTATHLLPRVHTRPTVCFHRVPFAAASFWGLLLSVNDRCLACNCHHLNAYLHRKLISAYRNTHCLAPLPAHTVSNPCSAGPTLHFALLSAIFYAIYLHSQCPTLSLHFPFTDTCHTLLLATCHQHCNLHFPYSCYLFTASSNAIFMMMCRFVANGMLYICKCCMHANAMRSATSGPNREENKNYHNTDNGIDVNWLIRIITWWCDVTSRMWWRCQRMENVLKQFRISTKIRYICVYIAKAI